MVQARVDNSVDSTFPSFLSPDLLILDDLASIVSLPSSRLTSTNS